MKTANDSLNADLEIIIDELKTAQANNTQWQKVIPVNSEMSYQVLKTNCEKEIKALKRKLLQPTFWRDVVGGVIVAGVTAIIITLIK